jgi:hypothetical protein
MDKQVKGVELFSIMDAVSRGIERVRLPIWADPFDHIKIDLMGDGGHGPFLHLYGPSNKAINGQDPVSMLFSTIGVGTKEWVEYTGPLPTSEEYKTKVAECNEWFK